jgi:acetyltransferase-like isoleucine patch superfamily enzyme
LFYITAAIFVKRCFIGKFRPGPTRELSQWQLLRHHLSATLLSRKKIQNVVDIVGRHYEFVSCLYRLLGAKVGKRVFWPGHQPVFSGEFDLLEIGDDVVFGSRSFIFCRSVDKCENVILCAGANVADNCLVLPGSIVGKNAVLGSNSVCPEGWFLPPGSVWFGSRGSEPICLEKGPESESSRPRSALTVDLQKLPMTGDDTTIRPFGRAFYEGKATYFVWPLSWIVAVTGMVKTLIAIFHALPLLLSLQGAAYWLFDGSIHERGYHPKPHSFVTMYLAVHFVFFWVNILRVCLWFLIEVYAKQAIMGRRQEGRFNYDSTDYAQRWELYQLISKVRRFSRFNFLDFFAGTPYMTSYFRALGGRIGENCVLYPAGADPFMPEPDLVVMGDRCVIDRASLVAHLNTRGNFELAKIVLESDCTLRTQSRLQQGVYMEAGSQLLEKSVAMTGEVIERNSVWLGCPASCWFLHSDSSLARGFSDESLEDSSGETSQLLSRQLPLYSA